MAIPSQDPDEAERYARDFVRQFYNKDTAKYPQGKLNDDDGGELAMAVVLDKATRTKDHALRNTKLGEIGAETQIKRRPNDEWTSLKTWTIRDATYNELAPDVWIKHRNFRAPLPEEKNV